MKSEKKQQHLTPHAADKYRGGQMRATACIVACSPTTGSVFFCRRGLGSYHSQLLLSGRRKPLNATHGTATAMQLSKFWAFLCVLGRSLSSRRAWSVELVAKLCLGPPWFFFRSHRRGTLCYGLYPWAGLFLRSPLVEVHGVSPRLWSSIVPKQQSWSSTIQSVVLTADVFQHFIKKSIRSDRIGKYFGASFSIRSDRVAIYFPRPNLQMSSWWFIFWPIIRKFKSIHEKKSIWIDSIRKVFFVNTGPNTNATIPGTKYNRIW